jgi:hypothetical protein
VQLLVSVRNAMEAAGAVDGGADVVDAKEPSAGPLGAVAAEALAALAARVPAARPLSVALGDVDGPVAAADRIAGLTLPERAAPTWVKLGLLGTPEDRLEAVLQSAAAAAAAHRAAPRVIAVAYADAAAVGAPAPEAIRRAAARAGAAGVLLDTARKDGGGLRTLLSVEALRRWVASVHDAGLLAAVAGQVTIHDLPTLAAVGPDVIGVRGAACDGGREGTLDAARVAALAAALRRAAA